MCRTLTPASCSQSNYISTSLTESVTCDVFQSLDCRTSLFNSGKYSRRLANGNCDVSGKDILEDGAGTGACWKDRFYSEICAIYFAYCGGMIVYALVA
jgi:hypothetical protein